jgi:hypothetical protein
LREGGSLPALEADDDFKYVLKFKGHGVKALIAELIGGDCACFKVTDSGVGVCKSR